MVRRAAADYKANWSLRARSLVTKNWEKADHRRRGGSLLFFTTGFPTPPPCWRKYNYWSTFDFILLQPVSCLLSALQSQFRNATIRMNIWHWLLCNVHGAIISCESLYTFRPLLKTFVEQFSPMGHTSLPQFVTISTIWQREKTTVYYRSPIYVINEFELDRSTS